MSEEEIDAGNGVGMVRLKEGDSGRDGSTGGGQGEKALEGVEEDDFPMTTKGTGIAADMAKQPLKDRRMNELAMRETVRTEEEEGRTGAITPHRRNPRRRLPAGNGGAGLARL